MQIEIKIIPHSGGLILSALVGIEYYRQTYYGYTRREAIAEFRAYVKAEESKLIREVRK